MTQELNVFNICKLLDFDMEEVHDINLEEVHDINLIEEVCREDDIMSLCIFAPLKMILVSDTKFPDKFNLDDSI